MLGEEGEEEGAQREGKAQEIEVTREERIRLNEK